MKRITLVILSVIFLAINASAQTIIDWSGELRLRSEIDGRNFDLDTRANTYTLSRARLGAMVKPAENIGLFLQIQDSRVFGSEPNTLANTANLDLHQGYLQVRGFLAEQIDLKAGRMELSYGNERLIGSVGWHNVGRSFDGGVIGLNFDNLSIDIMALNIREVHNYAPVATPGAVQAVDDTGHNLLGIYSKTKPGDNVDGDFYLLYEQDRFRVGPDGDRRLSRFTLGTWLRGSSAEFWWQTESAIQFGKTAGTDIRAFMFTGQLAFRPDNETVSQLAIGLDYLSGTAADEDDYRTFDPVYHTGHKFYGFMDYFINIPAQTFNRGLIDLYLQASFRFSETITLDAWLHNFWLQQKLADHTFAGTEIDLVSNWKYHDNLSFMIGWSVFQPGDVMKQIFQNDDLAHYGYISARVHF
ncbi:MAG: hypothetical protein EA364_15690 [Balneolaceae bacterium]|nr:MAG: hypothetical protein EA364_15690 [Balneolaceae bacterium]